MGNGMNKVLPGLYVGNYRDSKDQTQLEKFQITHIVAIHDSPRRLLPDKHYLCVMASDTPDQNLSQYFSVCNDFIHAARLREGNVLIHCLAGMSRSVTVAVAYIMTATNLNFKEALKVVRAGRAVANPNIGFQTQLQEFEAYRLSEERRRLRERFPSSALEQLDRSKCVAALVNYKELLENHDICEGNCSRGEKCPTVNEQGLMVNVESETQTLYSANSTCSSSTRSSRPNNNRSPDNRDTSIRSTPSEGRGGRGIMLINQQRNSNQRYHDDGDTTTKVELLKDDAIVANKNISYTLSFVAEQWKLAKRPSPQQQSSSSSSSNCSTTTSTTSNMNISPSLCTANELKLSNLRQMEPICAGRQKIMTTVYYYKSNKATDEQDLTELLSEINYDEINNQQRNKDA